MLVASQVHAAAPVQATDMVSGWQLRIDAGPSARFANGDGASGNDAWALGIGLAFVLRRGISIDGRYEDLGISRGSTSTPLQTATAGIRYALRLPVRPFAELRCGTAFDITGAFFASAIALGLEVPVSRFLRVEVSVRDWLVPDSAMLHSIATFNVGLTVRFVQ